MTLSPKAPLRIAVIGSGISGLSAAWLLSRAHEVTLYEADGRLGGHAHTVDAQTARGSTPVDTGFIVYNEPNYPNLTALFAHLGVETLESEMSFAVSLDGGAFEYGTTGLEGLLAQRRNLFRPVFWNMIGDVLKFQRHGAADASRWTNDTTLSAYMAERGFCRGFQEDHLLPQAAAIWSASLKDIGDYPVQAMLRFFDNHGLLKLAGRPQWRTVAGGSRAYVNKVAADFRGRVLLSSPVKAVTRFGEGVLVETAGGVVERYDRVVIAAHADQALAMLSAPTAAERQVLGAFGYSRNRTVLHTDASFMPSRRAAWSSWNHQGRSGLDDQACITYWMNHLQSFIPSTDPLFVTLNPPREIAPGRLALDQVYEHPLFNHAAIAAQPLLPGLQGEGGVWFCGAYFGHGFHEDGLQAGLAAAEGIGGVRRPWQVANASGAFRTAADQTGGGVNGLYCGQVTHARLSPRRHSLAYRIFMVRLDLDAPAPAQTRLFSLNRFNLLSVHERDHGDGSGTPLRQQIAARLEQAGLAGAAAHIEMLAMPRILGRAFNPLTVYFCRDHDGRLGAVVYEVNNTFGERHNYMIAAGVAHKGGAVAQGAPKMFHVSPFMDMDLDYRFDVSPPDQAVAVRIAVTRSGEPVLNAAFTARGQPMTDAALLRAWLTHPWQTLGVLAAIHWEALKIVLMGFRYRPKPPAPAAPVTVGRPL